MKHLSKVLLLESEDWVEVWSNQEKIYAGHGNLTSLDLESILIRLGHGVTARLGTFNGEEFIEDNGGE